MPHTYQTNFPELTREQNGAIQQARDLGFGAYWPCAPSAEAQAHNTLKGAQEFLEQYAKDPFQDLIAHNAAHPNHPDGSDEWEGFDGEPTSGRSYFAE